MSTERKPSVKETMNAILNYINSPQEQKNLAGNLAAIRNSTGKDIEEAAELWPILFPLLPEAFLGNGTLTFEEKALIVSLQLYAIGQQGSNKTAQDDSNFSMGHSLQRIRDRKDSKALDRRVNTMLTAVTFDEFVYHLRQIFKLGKSKESFSVDYTKLAEELFMYQIGGSRQVCLNWAKDYYRPDPNNGKEKMKCQAPDKRRKRKQEDVK